VVRIAMKAIFNGQVLAESDDIVMADGNPYFPRPSMRPEFFRESTHTTVCGWKGTARYWDVVVGDQSIGSRQHDQHVNFLISQRDRREA